MYHQEQHTRTRTRTQSAPPCSYSHLLLLIVGLTLTSFSSTFLPIHAASISLTTIPTFQFSGWFGSIPPQLQQDAYPLSILQLSPNQTINPQQVTYNFNASQQIISTLRITYTPPSVNETLYFACVDQNAGLTNITQISPGEVQASIKWGRSTTLNVKSSLLGTNGSKVVNTTYTFVIHNLLSPAIINVTTVKLTYAQGSLPGPSLPYKLLPNPNGFNETSMAYSMQTETTATSITILITFSHINVNTTYENNGKWSRWFQFPYTTTILSYTIVPRVLNYMRLSTPETGLDYYILLQANVIPTDILSLRLYQSSVKQNLSLAAYTAAVYIYSVNAVKTAQADNYELTVNCTDPCNTIVEFPDSSIPMSNVLTPGVNTLGFGPVQGGTTQVINLRAVNNTRAIYTILLTIPPSSILCQNVTCANGGICLDQANNVYKTDFTCYCTSSYWTGALCDIPNTGGDNTTSSHPVAFLSTSASLITNCTLLTLDGSRSYNLGPASLQAKFEWKVVSIKVTVSSSGPSGTAEYEIINYESPQYNASLAKMIFTTAPHTTILNSTSFPFTSSSLSINGTDLLDSSVYVFTLRVLNNIDSSTPVAVDVKKVGGPMKGDTVYNWTPSLSLYLPSLITRPTTTSFFSVLTPSLCADLPKDVVAKYVWQANLVWKTDSLSPYPLASSLPASVKTFSFVSSSSSSFTIPPNFFLVGYTYSLTLTATLSHPQQSELVNLTTDTMFFTSSTPIVAAIIGSDRSKPINEGYSLSAEGSYDPDYFDPNNPTGSMNASQAGGGLKYQWSCTYLNTNTACKLTPINLMNLNSPVLYVLPPIMMPLGTVYVWTVRVTSLLITSRSATDSVRITAIAAPSVFLPVVTILNAPKAINVQDTLRLSVTVVSRTTTSQNDMWYAWSCSSSSSVLAKLPNLASPDVLGGPASTSSLILLPDLLSPGVVYTFSVTVTDPLTVVPETGKFAQSTTSVIITVNGVPQPGSCSVTPVSGGIALSTAFSLTCQGWFEPLTMNYQPFSYEIQYRDTTGSSNNNNAVQIYQHLTSPTLSTTQSFFLPSGSFLLRVIITDQLGSSSISNDLPVTVIPSDQENFNMLQYIWNLTFVSLPTVVDSTKCATDPSIGVVFVQQIAKLINDAWVVYRNDPVGGSDNSTNNANTGNDDTPTYEQLLLLQCSQELVSTLLYKSWIQVLALTSTSSATDLNFILKEQSLLRVLSECLVVLTQPIQTDKDGRMYSDKMIEQTTLLVEEMIHHALTTSQASISGGSGAVINPTQIVSSLSIILSRLLSSCSQLDAISSLIHSLLRFQQLHSIHGESISIDTLSYSAYVLRSLVSAGTEIHLPSGNSVMLSEAGMKTYAARLEQLNLSTIDTVTGTNQAEMDTRIVTFGIQWAQCRLNNSTSIHQTPPTQQPSSISQLTSIELTFPNGDPIDISLLDTEIEFDLPITPEVASSIIDQYLHSLTCPPADPTDRVTLANSALTCQFWNVTTKSYSSQGCRSKGITYIGDAFSIVSGVKVSGTAILHCACSHLTEFAILLNEAHESYDDEEDVCGLNQNHISTSVGDVSYLVFLILYSLIGLIAIVQTVRIVLYVGINQYGIITIEHILIFLFSLFRTLNMSMYYTLYKQIDIKTQMILSGLPYLFYSWIFTLVIVTWASIWSSSTRGQRNENPLAAYKLQFFFGNILISAALFAVFGLMSTTTNLNELQQLNRVGIGITAFVEIGFGVFLVIYGMLLVRALTQHFVSKYSTRLAIIATTFCASFISSASILAYSAAQSDAYSRHIVYYNIGYFGLDIIGVCLVMLLFAKSISRSAEAATNTHTQRSGRDTRTKAESSNRTNGHQSAGVSKSAGGGKSLKVYADESTEPSTTMPPLNGTGSVRTLRGLPPSTPKRVGFAGLPDYSPSGTMSLDPNSPTDAQLLPSSHIPSSPTSIRNGPPPLPSPSPPSTVATVRRGPPPLPTFLAPAPSNHTPSSSHSSDPPQFHRTDSETQIEMSDA